MNRIYTIIKNQDCRVELCKEALLWKTVAKRYMQPAKIPSVPLRVGPILWSANWLTKEEKVRKVDIHNAMKLLLDSISQKYGVDDSYFWEVGPMVKIHRADSPSVSLVISLYTV